MTGVFDPIAGRGRVATVALWAGAGLVVSAAHAGAIMLALRAPQDVASLPPAPPAAIMIELAAEPEAVDTSENTISPDATDAQEVESETVEPVEEPVEPEVAERQPVVPPEPEPAPVAEQEIAEPVVPEPAPPEPVVPDPPVMEKADVPEQVVSAPPPPVVPEPEVPVDPAVESIVDEMASISIPVPVLKPDPEKAKPPVKAKPEQVQRKTAQKPPPPASKAQAKAKVDAKASNRVAASQTSSGQSRSGVSPAKWQSRLMAHLERRKRYPSASRSRREQGTAHVRFRIDTSGNVTSVSLARSSGFADLDQAVLDMVRRASPVPAPPEGVNKTITAPVQFKLR